MDESVSDKKPCLVPSEQGFSVSYKNKLLYSKYAPQNSILKSVESLSIPNQTLILAFSPVLAYGIKELIDKTPDNSYILAIESDPNLYEFALSQIPPEFFLSRKLSFHCCTSLNSFIELLRFNKVAEGRFRKSFRIDMSAGVRFGSLYETFQKVVDSAIAQFWKNRLTLTKLGRLYSRNIMQNLAYLPFSKQLQAGSVNKAILVVGAGPSLDTVITHIKNNANFLYIIAVDSALPALLAHEIKPDIVVAVESQLANEKAFIGTSSSSVLLLADLTSRTHIIRMSYPNVSFFVSEFADIGFLRKLNNRQILPHSIPALGSVGLAAIELALYLRLEDSPIITAGLDFAFIPGKTHCNGSPSHTASLSTSNRFVPIGNPAAAFRPGAGRIVGKNDITVTTDKTLSNYGASVSVNYSTKKMLFDLSPTGIYCGISQLPPEQLSTIANSAMSCNIEINQQKDKQSEHNQTESDPISVDNFKSKLINQILSFYDEEQAALEQLNNLLSNGGELSQILLLLANREYLYLHFPDGYKTPTGEISFLKRVRAETGFFLKEIQRGKAFLLKSKKTK